MSLRLGVIATIALALAVGIGAGCLMQAELWAPGIQVLDPSDLRPYNLARTSHDWLLSVLVPSLACGPAINLVVRRSPQAVLLVLLVGLATALGLFFDYWREGLGEGFAAPASARDIDTALACASLAAALGSAAFVDPTRASAWALAGMALLALITGVLGGLILITDADLPLWDTWYETAIAHALGLSVLLSLASILATWAGSSHNWIDLALAPVLGAGVLGLGLFWMLAEARPGLMGMPRGYSDYPSSFASGHALSAWLALGVIVAVALLAACLALLRLARPLPTPTTRKDA